jgi:hypothetical protein
MEKIVQKCYQSQHRTIGIMELWKDGFGLSRMMIILILKKTHSEFLTQYSNTPIFQYSNYP